MKKKGLFILAVGTLAVFAASGIYSKKTLATRDTTLLVELKDSDNLSRSEVQKNFVSELTSTIGFNYRVVSNYTYANNVVAIKLPSTSVDAVKTISNVTNVETSTFHQVSEYISNETDPGDGVLFSSSNNDVKPDKNYSAEQMNVPTTSNGGKGTIIAILDSSFLLSHEGYSSLTTSVRYSESQMKIKTSTSGFHGKSTLLHSTYYNNKVPFYYDYGGDSSGDTVVPDYDVYTKYSDHGQHVATLCAGNGSYKGIAPNAQLCLMKVFTTYATKSGTSVGATSEAILNALEDCAIIGVDDINLSLGSDLNDFSSDNNSVVYSTFDKLRDDGVSVNVAAGNSGKGQYSDSGPYSVYTTDNVETGILGSYSNTSSGMVIASGNLDADEGLSSSISVGDNDIPYRDQIVNHSGQSADGETSETKYDPQMPFSSLIPSGKSSVTLDYVMVPGWGEEKDYSGLDVKGKVAVIARGETYFSAKITEAKNHGAVACIIYNGTTDTMGWMDLSTIKAEDIIPTASCDNYLKNTFSDATTKKITISKDYISNYSADGSTYDLGLNPDIMTPGQNVYGAAISSDTSYQYMSGTSMATPNYSGAEALILGEKTFSSEEDRKAYAKTISMRTMSTADPVKKSGSDTYYTPRKQGAGYVDVSQAILTSVYLEGSDSKAKVELKNTSDVAKGTLKFDVKTHNESSSSKTYKATLYVEAPNVTVLDSVAYPDYKDTNFKTDGDKLLETYTFNVAIAAGDSSISVDHAISSESKAYLDKYFANGTYLEGYLVLTGSDTLSIPYMGFYGDYSSEDCVEPFDFEKESGKVYGSDLLNSLCRDTGLGLTNADFGSCIVATGKTELKDVTVETAITNSTNLKKLYTSVKAKYIDGVWNIYAGNNGYTNTLIFQQFVNRSVATNTITFTNAMTKKVVLTDHMFDISGSEDDYSLYRSMATDSLVSSNYVAHRAYTIIPLKNYADGTYNIHFEYTLSAGYTQTKDLVLHIDSTLPEIVSKTVEETNGTKTLKIKIKEDNISSVTVNDNTYDCVDGIVSVPYTDVSSSKFVKIVATDLSGGESVALSPIDSLSTGLEMNATNNSNVGGFTYTSVSENNGTLYVVTLLDKYSNKIKYDTKYTYNYSVYTGTDTADGINVYTYDNFGNKTKANYTFADGKVSFASSTGKFFISGIRADPNSISSTTIVWIAISVAVVLGIVISTVVITKKKAKRK